MIFRLLSGILTAVFVPLGVAFTLVGLLDHHPDRGSPEAFVYVGAAIAVAGFACLATFLVLWRREAARRRRRRQGLRAGVEVVSADLNWRVRVNGRPMLRLTVRLPGGAVSGNFVLRHWPPPDPGTRIDVVYDPADPANFEPVTA
jgi:hypothetical protein